MHPASELWPAANMLALFRPIGAAKCGLIFPLPIILSDVAAVVAHGRLCHVIDAKFDTIDASVTPRRPFTQAQLTARSKSHRICRYVFTLGFKLPPRTLPPRRPTTPDIGLIRYIRHPSPRYHQQTNQHNIHNLTNMNSTEAELESFRRKWREEVSARTKGKQPAPAVPGKTTQASSSKSQVQPSKSSAPDLSVNAWSTSEEVDERQPFVHPNLGEKQHGRRLDETSAQAAAASSSKEPKSALEHYEKAVEREDQGVLGDSLTLYRKAFKVRHTDADDIVH